MAKACQWRSIWLQVAIMYVLLVNIIDGVAAIGKVGHANTKMSRLVKPLKKPAATIKTIKSEHGDIVDCVDIYKQPAFDHPALKNHTIQMRPSNYTEEPIAGKRASSFTASLVPTNESCPGGTTPILRTRHNDMQMLTEEDYSTMNPITEDVMLMMNEGDYYGAEAFINTWDGLHVEPHEESSCLIILAKPNPSGANLISAGLTVSQTLYGDQRTRTTVYWTADGSRYTGCHNMNCPGFIQTSSELFLGAPFSPPSVYRGQQMDAHFKIYMDMHSNNWWLEVLDKPVGYWPADIFNDLSSASIINWGGRVGLQSASYCGDADFRHSTTQMGNGHYPSEGAFGISAYVGSALYRGSDNVDREPDDGGFYLTNRKCYNYLDHGNRRFSRPGRSFFYGGNGQSSGCY